MGSMTTLVTVVIWPHVRTVCLLCFEREDAWIDFGHGGWVGQFSLGFNKTILYPSHYSFPFSSLAFVVLGELLEIIMFKLSDDQTFAPGL